MIIIKICSEENDSLYKKGNDPYNNYWNFSVNPTYVRQNWNNSMELVISIYTLNKTNTTSCDGLEGVVK